MCVGVCVCVCMLTCVFCVYNIMLNKNTWGVKKVRGQEEPATKSSDIK